MNSGYLEHLQRVEDRRVRLGRTLAEMFPGGDAALSLEIGCGHGHWLVDFARQFPQKRCLGIDVIRDRIERAERKRDAASVTNVEFLRAEAMETLDLLPQGVELLEVFLLFPDPWPKKRHWKKRLFCEEFLSQLGTRCAEGTRLHFRTDHEGYFAWAVEAVASQKLWQRVDPVEWPFERETVFQSRAADYRSLIIVKH